MGDISRVLGAADEEETSFRHWLVVVRLSVVFIVHCPFHAGGSGGGSVGGSSIGRIINSQQLFV